MFLNVIIVIAALLLYAFYKSTAPKRKGASGEARVERKIRSLNDDEYMVMKNVLIKTSHGTSQIDHIIISVYGIFVIETKNYDGWIHGSEKSEYWKQTIYDNIQKFRNPIKQNWSHIYALKEVLNDFGYIQYYPIIVFAGKAELKNIYSQVPVIYAYELTNTIKKLSGTKCLTITNAKEIVDRINDLNIQDKKESKKHIQNIKEDLHKSRNLQKKLLCPKCGNALLERNGKYGKFYGCTNYPRCRYTRKK